MELLQLFDDNKKAVDEYVVRKPKCDIPPKRNIMYILLFIQNDEGKYLVQKTSKGNGPFLCERDIGTITRKNI